MRPANNLEIWKDTFRHILKISASMYESSGSQFFRTTTWMQSGPDTFGKSRVVMTFITNLRVTEILFSFRLVLEGKAHMKIAESSRLEFLEKCLTNSLLHQMQKTIPAGCWKRISSSRFIFVEKTIRNLLKIATAKFLGSDRAFHWIQNIYSVSTNEKSNFC